MELLSNINDIKYKFYADDLVILGTPDNVKRALRGLLVWATENNMIINRNKSGIIVMNKNPDNRMVEFDGFPVVN